VCATMETAYLRAVILKRHWTDLGASVAFKMWGMAYMEEADIRASSPSRQSRLRLIRHSRRTCAGSGTGRCMRPN
jgi:hypothetical protein